MSTVTRKRTRGFWRRLLKRRHTSYGKIAKDLGYNISVVRSYFIGKKYPNPEMISAICNYLIIDIDTGTKEFMKSHRAWCRNTGTECKIPQSDILKYKESRKVTNITVMKSASEFADILKLLYGKIPYDLFGELVDYSSEDIINKKYLKILYGKVDFGTFQKLIM